MLRINKEEVVPVRFDSLKPGDTFMSEGETYLVIRFDRRVGAVNLERANLATNFHADTRVVKREFELNILG